MAALDILAYATKCGLTAADFKVLSIGFVIDFCVTRMKLEKGKLDNEEGKYRMMKDHLPIIQRKFEEGKISEQRYQSFLERFKKMEAEYGFDY